MKNKLSYTIIFLLLFACESEKIFNEADYFELEKNDVENISLAGEASADKNINEQLISLGKKEKLLLPAGSDFLFYRFFISEDGTIDKITVLHNDGELSESEKNNIAKMNNWNFTPAVHNGEKIKYKLNFTYTSVETEPESIEKITNPEEEKSLDSYYPSEFEKYPEIIGGVQQLALLIKYPEMAKNAGLQGSVFIKAYLNETGDVEKVSVIRGIGSGCDVAAAEAVIKTKFSPAVIDGKPAKVQVLIPIKFKVADK